MAESPAAGPGSPRRRLALGFGLLAASTLLFARYVVQYFGGPILATGDMGVYAFTSFYFARNLTWLPWPRLELVTDWTLYPYGVDHVFLHWCFERDLFYTLARGLFGTGPWLQVYFLLSIALTAFGAAVVLRRYASPGIAAGLAFAVSFGNYYVVRKFPWQQPYACVHWTTLGILLDYVLVRRAWERRAWSAPLVLARAATLVLALGQDLGYVAGFSLLSFTVSAAWVGALHLARALPRSRAGNRPGGEAREAWRRLRASFRERRRLCLALVAVTLAAAWLYVPLAYQVARAAGSYDFSRVPQAERWEHPLRLAVPQLPGIEEEDLGELFGDRGEGSVAGHFRPGLAFVLAALFGLACGRRQWGVALPFLVVLALLVTFRPGGFAVLQALPWFGQIRVPGRATLVFPTLLVLFSLAALPTVARRRWARVVALLVVGLFIAETATVYSEVTRPKVRTSRRALVAYREPDAQLAELIRAIRASPGEAIFEWPFSISTRGGRFGTFRRYLAGIFALAELHEKKVMGAYFGRLHPEQLDPLRPTGWSLLFLPEGTPRLRNDYDSKRQRRDFVPEEWRFLRRFFARNDFCGLLLYPDLLPEEVVEGFYRRFGRPVAQAQFPGPGRVQFIPKPERLVPELDPEAGRRVRLEQPFLPIPVGETQLFRHWAIEDYLRGGWSKPESKHGRRARWIVARQATITFRLADPTRPTELALNLSGRAGTGIEWRLNGETIERLTLANEEEELFPRLRLQEGLVAEENTVQVVVKPPRPAAGEAPVPGPWVRVWWMRLDQAGAAAGGSEAPDAAAVDPVTRSPSDDPSVTGH